MARIRLGKSFSTKENPALRDSLLGTILDERDRNERTMRVLSALLTDDYRKNCLRIVDRRTRITLFVPSSTWATRFRFERERLMKELHRLPEYRHLEKIVVSVSPK